MDNWDDIPPSGDEVRRLYDTLHAECVSGRKRSNLELLWEVLDHLRSRAGFKISIASVGRELELLPGSLRTQSIYNPAGKEYRTLIQAFQNLQDRSRHQSNRRSGIDGALDSVLDTTTRETLRLELERAKRVLRENEMFRSMFKNLAVSVDGVVHPRHRRINPGQPGLVQVDSGDALVSDLTKTQYRSIQVLVCSDWLVERGLKENVDGSVRQGESLFLPPGTMPALRAILTIFSPGSSEEA